MSSIAQTRLYYSDSYRWVFDAEVVECRAADGGFEAVLNATYLYPSSGGQPNDFGTIAGRQVVDVLIRDSDGAVVHRLDGPVPLGHATATVDSARRLDHMQQHTGQHILSQAFVRTLDAATIGFHLGREYVSIDLDTPVVTDPQRDQAFALANEVVRRDAAVRAWFPSAEELATITLRKTPDVEGALRIVAVGDFDVSACGGTHVARTGEVGLIHCLKTEKLKRGVRVSFLAGDRARADYQLKHRILQGLSASLTCAVAELPAAVARLQEELTAANRALERHREEALDREALALAAEADHQGVIRKVWTARPVDQLKGLAQRLTESPNVIALLATVNERTQFVFARPDTKTADLKAALDRALAAIGGGKGGGGRIVQGGGAAAPAEQVDAALAAATLDLLAS